MPRFVLPLGLEQLHVVLSLSAFSQTEVALNVLAFNLYYYFMKIPNMYQYHSLKIINKDISYQIIYFLGEKNIKRYLKKHLIINADDAHSRSYAGVNKATSVFVKWPKLRSVN